MARRPEGEKAMTPAERKAKERTKRLLLQEEMRDILNMGIDLARRGDVEHAQGAMARALQLLDEM